QQDFPVVEQGEMVGILTRRKLLETLSEAGRDPYVCEVMETSPPAVRPTDPLDQVLEEMMADGHSVVPVHDAGGLCGLLTAENAGEFVMVRTALRHARQIHERR